ncbi:MAG: hypothetical protein CW691_11700 [Candidatus Bathyarchaeum sp.]|nr:MAG: hypothetical protein CW691_11700 [Candidatus Bathyarchaeum sp.]
MNLKKRFELRIQGWLPKEPNFHAHQRPVRNSSWRTYQTMSVVLVIVAAFVGALLGALGHVLNLTNGIGLYFWSMTIGITLGIAVSAILIRMKKNEKQPTI